MFEFLDRYIQFMRKMLHWLHSYYVAAC